MKKKPWNLLINLCTYLAPKKQDAVLLIKKQRRREQSIYIYVYIYKQRRGERKKNCGVGEREREEEEYNNRSVNGRTNHMQLWLIWL